MEKNTEREWDQPVSQAVIEMDWSIVWVREYKVLMFLPFVAQKYFISPNTPVHIQIPNVPYSLSKMEETVGQGAQEQDGENR